MRRSDLVQHKEKENGRINRTSQIVFGERQHLLRVLDSLEGTHLPIARMQQERRTLEELIHARTKELNQINTAWDEKIGLVLSAEAKPEMLEKLAKQAPPEDFYMLRLISEHPRTNAKTLGKLAKHPYGAIRENVARHPNADAARLPCGPYCYSGAQHPAVQQHAPGRCYNNWHVFPRGGRIFHLQAESQKRNRMGPGGVIRRFDSVFLAPAHPGRGFGKSRL